MRTSIFGGMRSFGYHMVDVGRLPPDTERGPDNGSILCLISQDHLKPEDWLASTNVASSPSTQTLRVRAQCG